MSDICSFSDHTFLNYFELICKNFITSKDEELHKTEKLKLEMKLKKKILQIFFEFLHEEHKKNLNFFRPKGVDNKQNYKNPIFTIKSLHRHILEYSFWFFFFFN